MCLCINALCYVLVSHSHGKGCSSYEYYVNKWVYMWYPCPLSCVIVSHGKGCATVPAMNMQISGFIYVVSMSFVRVIHGKDYI